MRMFVYCTVLIGLVLASCAESTHQRQRINIENRPDDGPSQSAETHMTRMDSAPSLYSQLKAAPVTYAGKVVTLSGIVLRARRLQGTTEVEILQLPEGVDGRPAEDRRQSEGRFLARQTTAFLDPAILATAPVVTVVGSVEESVERPLEPGSDSYSYPVIAIQQLTVWPKELIHSNGPSYPLASGAGGLNVANTSPNFALDVIGSVLSGIFQAIFNSSRSEPQASYSPSSHSSASSSASPSSPPPKDIPPQFRKPN